MVATLSQVFRRHRKPREREHRETPNRHFAPVGVRQAVRALAVHERTREGQRVTHGELSEQTDVAPRGVTVDRLRAVGRLEQGEGCEVFQGERRAELPNDHGRMQRARTTRVQRAGWHDLDVGVCQQDGWHRIRARQARGREVRLDSESCEGSGSHLRREPRAVDDGRKGVPPQRLPRTQISAEPQLMRQRMEVEHWRGSERVGAGGAGRRLHKKREGDHHWSGFPASGTNRLCPNRALPNSPMSRCVAVSTRKSANARPPATLMRGAFFGFGSRTWYTLYSSGSPWTSDTRSILLF